MLSLGGLGGVFLACRLWPSAACTASAASVTQASRKASTVINGPLAWRTTCDLPTCPRIAASSVFWCNVWCILPSRRSPGCRLEREDQCETVYLEETVVINGTNCLCMWRVFALRAGRAAAEAVGAVGVSAAVPAPPWGAALGAAVCRRPEIPRDGWTNL